MYRVTASFSLLSQSWEAFTEHWRFSAFLSFIGSLFAYLLGAENKELLLILATLIAIDTALGTVVALKKRCFNSTGMRKGIVKVVLYGSFLIMFHLAELTIDGSAGFQIHLIDLIAYLYLIVREAKSSNEKLAMFNIGTHVNPFLVIEKILNRYAEDFDKTFCETPPNPQWSEVAKNDTIEKPRG